MRFQNVGFIAALALVLNTAACATFGLKPKVDPVSGQIDAGWMYKMQGARIIGYAAIQAMEGAGQIGYGQAVSESQRIQQRNAQQNALIQQASQMNPVAYNTAKQMYLQCVYAGGNRDACFERSKVYYLRSINQQP